jgi:hypothetical protein
VRRRQVKGNVVADRPPLAGLSDPELEQRLADLGPWLYPTTPDLAAQVRHRLESDPVRSSPSPQPARSSGHPAAGTRPAADRREDFLSSPRSEGRRVGDEGRSWAAGLESRALWLVAALLLIAIAGGLVLFPEARYAIADRLGLQGVLIRWVDEVPSPEPSQLGAPLLLGRPVTLDEAQAAVDFSVRVPTAPGFDDPSEIYLLDQEQGAMVSFVYPTGPELPASDETGVGALLTQFQGDAERGLIEKGLADSDEPETYLEAVTVRGDPGYWISGAPHGFFFVCYDAGECRQERYRLAGNVLLWEQDGVTLRLESALSREDALAIAESVPAPE